MRKALKIALTLIVCAAVAIWLWLSTFTFDTNLHLRSDAETNIGDRIKIVREFLQTPLPIEDAHYDIFYTAGGMTPGPASLDACILLKTPPSSLIQWGKDWQPSLEGMGLCHSRLASVSNAVLPRSVPKVLMKPSIPDSTREELIALYADESVILARITQ
jgi:hypothetical protein